MTPASSSPADLQALVQEELALLCSSDDFRNSKQTVKLLRYLVENSLGDQEELLRERAIGVRIFGRDPKYDTGEDAIVRVSAAELRKRLARHYHGAKRQAAIQLSIPVGSYRVEFQRAEVAPPAPVTAPPPPKRRRVPWLAAAGLLAAAAVAAVAWLWPKPALTLFWEPALSDRATVSILAPHPTVYTFTRETFQRLRGDSASHAQRQIEDLTAPANAAIPWKEVVPIRDQYVGVGSALAIGDLTALFAVREKPFHVRFGRDYSFQDIRQSPSVLIGAYANRWTLQLTDDLRFVLSESDGAPEILDRSQGRRWRLNRLRADGRTPEDYVVVSRLLHPKTGRLVVALAGITQYGTQAAGEFVTDEALLQAATKHAPREWDRGNMQFVLHVPIVEGVPSRPSVVADHFWK